MTIRKAPLTLVNSNETDELPKSEHAYLALRERIMLGQYAPGQRIKHTDLISHFGWSGTPIRLALKNLVDQGYLISIRLTDSSIMHWTPEAYEDAQALRLSILVIAAGRAAQRRNERDLATLLAIQDFKPDWINPTPDDADQFVVRTALFFEALARVSQVHNLPSILNSVFPIALHRLACQSATPAIAEQMFAAFGEIYKSIEIGDVDAAETALSHSLTTQYLNARPAIFALSQLYNDNGIQLGAPTLAKSSFVADPTITLPFMKGRPEPSSLDDWLIENERSAAIGLHRA